MAEKCPGSLGRYKLLALLATGGMAEIHLARQTGIQGFERLAVVKRIRPHLAGEARFLEMFFDEARLVAQLNHPNIVQIYELGQEGENYFIAMEYLEGESLAFLLHEARKARQHLPHELAAGIIAQAAEGLDYAHQLSDDAGRPLHIVHRDVSPQNIIVLFSGGVKLIDFGIARAASQVHETKVGTLKGKMSYMSPEQCRGQDLDGRSDVFCLGIVFWELLAHTRLFRRQDDVATLHAIVYEDVPALRTLRPEVPEALEAVVARALQKDPAARFQSAGEMGQAIRDHLRQTGAAAGNRELAEFVHAIFGQRARTKRALLEEVKKSDGAPLALAVLKPDTYASLPSGSKEVDGSDVALKPASAAERAEQITTVSPEGARPRAPRARRSAWPWILPILLLAGAGGLLGFLALDWPARDTPADAAGEVPAGAPERPDAGPALEGADAAPAPTPAAPRPGLLAVRSTPPGCRAELDGQPVDGLTPLADLALKPGQEHEIRVLCDRHAPESKVIALGDGQRAELSFAPAALQAAPPKKTWGLLKLNTEPWSDIYLGKRKLGTTPLLGVRLPVGTHRLTAVNPGRKLSKTIVVNIDPDKPAVVWKDLTR